MLTSCELRRTPANTPRLTLVRGSSIRIPEPLVPSEGSRGSRGICDDRSLSACPRLPTIHTRTCGVGAGRPGAQSLAGCGPQPSEQGRAALASVGTGQRPQLAADNSRQLGPRGLSAEAGHPENAAPAPGARCAKLGEGNVRRRAPATHTRGPRRCGVLTGLCACSARSCARVVFSASSRGLQRTAPRVSDSALRAPECVFDV